MLSAYKYQVLNTYSVLGSVLGAATFLPVEPHGITITPWESKAGHYRLVWPHGPNSWETCIYCCFYFLTSHSVFNLLHSSVCLHHSIGIASLINLEISFITSSHMLSSIWHCQSLLFPLFSLIFPGNILSWFSSHISIYFLFSFLNFLSFEDP